MFALVLWSSQRRACTKHFLIYASAIFSFSLQYKNTDFFHSCGRYQKHHQALSLSLSSCAAHPLATFHTPTRTSQLLVTRHLNCYMPPEAGPSQHERVSSHLSVKFVWTSKRSSKISVPDNVSNFS